MSNYTKLTNFTAKDTLPTGNPSKIILGAEHDTEYDAIETAVATKADKISGGTDGNVVTRDSTGNIVDSGVSLADAHNLWVTLYNLPSPQAMSTAIQEDVLSDDYDTYRIYGTYSQDAASTLRGRFTYLGTQDSDAVYDYGLSRLALSATPGPTVTGATGYDFFLNSSLITAGPVAGGFEITMIRRKDFPRRVWVRSNILIGSEDAQMSVSYTANTNIPDGVWFFADANTTMESFIILGLRSS